MYSKVIVFYDSQCCSHSDNVLHLTEESYNALEKATPPEIQRSNLASVILHLKALGIDNVLRFNFISVCFYLLCKRLATPTL